MTSLENLAFICRAEGKYADAVTYYQQALNIAIKNLGQDNPTTRTIQFNLRQLKTLMQGPEPKGSKKK